MQIVPSLWYPGDEDTLLKLLRSVALAVLSFDDVVVSGCSLARILGKIDSNFFVLSIHRICCLESYHTVRVS